LNTNIPWSSSKLPPMTDYQFAYLTSTTSPGFLSAQPLSDRPDAENKFKQPAQIRVVRGSTPRRIFNLWMRTQSAGAQPPIQEQEHISGRPERSSL
jgi:hypothetical protein